MFNITWQTFSTDIFGFHPDILSIISFTFSVSSCNLAGPGKKKWMHQPAKLNVYFEFWSFIFLEITDSCSSQNSKEHTYDESLFTWIFRRRYYTNFPPFVCLAILTFKYFRLLNVIYKVFSKTADLSPNFCKNRWALHTILMSCKHINHAIHAIITPVIRNQNY